MTTRRPQPIPVPPPRPRRNSLHVKLSPSPTKSRWPGTFFSAPTPPSPLVTVPLTVDDAALYYAQALLRPQHDKEKAELAEYHDKQYDDLKLTIYRPSAKAAAAVLAKHTKLRNDTSYITAELEKEKMAILSFFLVVVSALLLWILKGTVWAIVKGLFREVF